MARKKKKKPQNERQRGGIVDKMGILAKAISDMANSLANADTKHRLEQRTDMRGRSLEAWSFLDALSEKLGTGPIATFIESYDRRAIAGRREYRKELVAAMDAISKATQIPPFPSYNKPTPERFTVYDEDSDVNAEE